MSNCSPTRADCVCRCVAVPELSKFRKVHSILHDGPMVTELNEYPDAGYCTVVTTCVTFPGRSHEKSKFRFKQEVHLHMWA